ncbi:uncharacterized protein N7503_006775 [Penicillium pulvis]|uniref:uncharacterized protein n=1 Tax=Penicillium pulvis TaxID=1562058 RepID=UPI002548276E|nr:uncharacterized protein N7503_006775 [Penicillium pulvis]KAJ5797479.1 hypothetical protein N7503_006775 [Penicillium pulvis]
MVACYAREAGLVGKEPERIQEVTQTHIANDREVSVANMLLTSECHIEDLQAVSGELNPILPESLQLQSLLTH